MAQKRARKSDHGAPPDIIATADRLLAEWDDGVADLRTLIIRDLMVERERCATLIEANMLVEPNGVEMLIPRSNPGNKVGFAYAAAIRKGAQ